MPNTEEIRVPDIGDFDAVDVIEVLVSPGDQVEAEDGLITLESEKASMDVPSPMAGTVKEVKVSAGDQVAQGDVIVLLETGEEAGEEEEQPAAEEDAPEEAGEKKEKKAKKATKDEEKKKEGKDRKEKAGKQKEKREQHEKKADEEKPEKKRAEKAEKAPERPEALSSAREQADLHAEVLVLGSGPGGYTAAFRAADLGRKVVLVERYPTLGGVCLNVGCIPSKALLHAAKVIDDAREMGERGIHFGEPEIDLDALRFWKDDVVGKLTKGLSQLASRRDVEVVRGTGTFASEHTLSVENEEGETTTVSFDAAIVAAGSRVIEIPGIPWDDPRVMDSTAALEIEEVPERLLVVGGGIIGLEMASVYEALGSKVTVVEMLDRLMTGADKDLVKPLVKRIEPRYQAIHLETKVAQVKATDEGLEATFEAAGDGEAPEPATFDRVLVAVGRRSNGDRIGAEAAGIEVDERGVIPVDVHQRTNVAHIFAIGDVVGPQLLAHKATHQGKVAAEVASGERSAFDAKVVPAVAYTDPEVAWCGLTEEEAKAEGREVGKGVFPWSASGRALGMARGEGMTKLLFDPETGRLLGGGIVGPSAGDLISEVALAIEMGAVAEDVGLTIHPHPTLSETVAFAAEAFEGTLTELYKPRRRDRD